MFARLIRLDALRNQSVKREGLVERAHHEGLEHIGVEPLGGRARFQIERVETVECALKADGEPPALGRVRIGIGQMREIGRQSRLAMHGNAMAGPHGLSGQGTGHLSGKSQKGSTGKANRGGAHGGDTRGRRGPAKAGRGIPLDWGRRLFEDR